MNKQSLLFTLLAALLIPAVVGLSFAGIAGSKHDFSNQGWNTTGETCIVCHTPHNARPSASGSVLWNRPLSNAVYTLYNSPTTNHIAGQPDGSTKLCLSCHDGTVALDSFGTQTGSHFISGGAKVGTDLSSSHPVSFVYDSALAAADRGLRDPSVAPSGLGGTIAADLLRAGKLQCVSCHDVHNRYSNPDLLIRSNSGSALCLTCHSF